VIKEMARDFVAWLKTQYSNYAILYGAYVAVLGSVFLTNSLTVPHRLFLWIVLPLALAPTRPISFSSIRSIGKINVGSLLAYPRKNIPSLLFWAAALYLLLLAWSSLSQQFVDPDYVRRDFLVSFEIAAFLLVTALLVVKRPNFLSSFFIQMGALTAISALINMVVFAWDTQLPAALENYRLVPVLGMTPYFGSTAISLTYAIYFVGAVAILFENGLSRLQRWILAMSAAILLCGILWTQARSAFIAVIVALAALAPSFSRKTRLAIGGAAIAVILAFVATPVGRTVLLSRGSSERLDLWQKYSLMAAERPWLGYGQFSAYGARNVDMQLDDGMVVFHPHNLVLSSQIRGGIFAAAAMAAILLGGLYWGWRYWLVRRSMAPLCLVLTMGVAGMFDYELVVTYPTWPWVTFWVPIGVGIGAELAARQSLGESVESLGARSVLDPPGAKINL
jgi:O-antigen ligase